MAYGIENLTANQMRGFLKQLGLSSSGSKAEMIATLNQAVSDGSGNSIVSELKAIQKELDAPTPDLVSEASDASDVVSEAGSDVGSDTESIVSLSDPEEFQPFKSFRQRAQSAPVRPPSRPAVRPIVEESDEGSDSEEVEISSPKRKSPKKTSPRRKSKSPKRKSKSPRRKASPKRRSSKSKSPSRTPDQSWTLAQLKVAARSVGVAVSGTKAQLIKRIKNSDGFEFDYNNSSSPKRKKKTPKRKSKSPKKTSPKRKSKSPKRKSKSPKRKSKSPKRKSKSPKKRSQTPDMSWTLVQLKGHAKKSGLPVSGSKAELIKRLTKVVPMTQL
jgi:hypothetical protein